MNLSTVPLVQLPIVISKIRFLQFDGQMSDFDLIVWKIEEQLELILMIIQDGGLFGVMTMLFLGYFGHLSKIEKQVPRFLNFYAYIFQLYLFLIQILNPFIYQTDEFHTIKLFLKQFLVVPKNNHQVIAIPIILITRFTTQTSQFL